MSSNANPLKDGAGNVIPAQRVIDDARRIYRLIMGRVGNGVGGLGGGAMYGLIEYSYVARYWDAGETLLFYRECIFHEFAHCMGYGHSGTMTYGDGWTRLTQELVREWGSKGKFPISNSNWGTNYPQ